MAATKDRPRVCHQGPYHGPQLSSSHNNSKHIYALDEAVTVMKGSKLVDRRGSDIIDRDRLIAS